MRAGFRGLDGRTLFDAAARGGTTALPDLNVMSDCSGRSALYLATCLGHEETARRLVAAGTDVNFRDAVDGCDVLFKAVQGGLEDSVGLLVVAGASPNTRGEGGNTSPRRLGPTRMVTTLVRGAEKDALDDKRDTPLLKAGRNGHSGVVGILMAAGADAYTRGGEEDFPVVLKAVCEGHVGVLQVLVNYWVDLTAMVGLSTQIHVAARANQACLVDFLIEAGADKSKIASFGYTPFLCAAGRCTLEAMRTLLSHGAAIDAKASQF